MFVLTCLAVTGLFLIGINVVVVKTILKQIGRYAIAKASTKPREVLNAEDIAVGSLPIEQYESFISADVLTHPVIEDSNFLATSRKVVPDEGTYGDWLVGEDHAGWVQTFVRMPDGEISHGNFLAFIEHAGNDIENQALSWRFPAVDYLRSHLDRCPVQWKIWKRDTDPCPLIHAHSFSHVASLRKVSKESEDRDKNSGIELPDTQKAWRFLLCLFHGAYFSIVGIFLTRRFRENWVSGRAVRSLFFLGLVAVSAAHVLKLMFEVTDLF